MTPTYTMIKQKDENLWGEEEQLFYIISARLLYIYYSLENALHSMKIE